MIQDNGRFLFICNRDSEAWSTAGYFSSSSFRIGKGHTIRMCLDCNNTLLNEPYVFSLNNSNVVMDLKYFKQFQCELMTGINK